MSTLLHHHTPLRAAMLALTVLTAQAVGTVAAVTVTEADTTAAADPRLAPDFVTASLLLASPGEKVYQIFGHAAIRMQCPAHGLDNVFTYEVDPGAGFFDVIFNKARARFAAVDFKEYVGEFASEGREVVQLRLNLSPAEKQRLWQILDEKAFGTFQSSFNPFGRHCLTMSLDQIDLSLGGGRLRPSESAASMDNGQKTLAASRGGNEWHRMVCLSTLGTSADVTQPLLQVPANMAGEYAGWSIDDGEGKLRPLFSGEPELLTRRTSPVDRSPVTPLAVAIFIAFTVLACAAAARARHMVVVARAVAVTVMALLAAGWSVLMLFSVSDITASSNWFMVVFNPLPLIGWATLRRKPFFPLAATVYGAVQIAFGAFSPLFTSQANAPLSVLAIALGAAAIIATTDKTNHK